MPPPADVVLVLVELPELLEVVVHVHTPPPPDSTQSTSHPGWAPAQGFPGQSESVTQNSPVEHESQKLPPELEEPPLLDELPVLDVLLHMGTMPQGDGTQLPPAQSAGRSQEQSSA